MGQGSGMQLNRSTWLCFLYQCRVGCWLQDTWPQTPETKAVFIELEKCLENQLQTLSGVHTSRTQQDIVHIRHVLTWGNSLGEGLSMQEAQRDTKNILEKSVFCLQPTEASIRNDALCLETQFPHCCVPISSSKVKHSHSERQSTGRKTVSPSFYTEIYSTEFAKNRRVNSATQLCVITVHIVHDVE